MSPSEFVGVDGCKAGWFSVGLDRSSGYEMKVFGGFTKLLSYYQNAALVLVDIPVGLPEGPEGRECDRATRTLLGKRRSSVFPTPTRLTVYKAAESPADYARAAEVERRVAGKGISKQAFAIAPKIPRWIECWRLVARTPRQRPEKFIQSSVSGRLAGTRL